MDRNQTRAGFTLVETMITLVITGVMSMALVQMVQVGQQSSDHNRILAEMQQNARVGLSSLTDDLRHVSYGKDPTQPSINYAGPDSVCFIADLLDANPGAEQVIFYLSRDGDPDTPNPYDTILFKEVRDTLGTVLYRAPQAYGMASSGLAFRWFNGGGTELPNPVPQPEQIGEILVTLRVAASRAIEGNYPDLELSSTVYPRNLPLSPARSRPSSPACSDLTFPNCEAATMSWTTPTTNTDGTPLALADISHFALYFGTDPDQLSLYTKLARTLNEWTISGMDGGQVYHIAVTCVSRSGVESYRCGRQADLSSTDIPSSPVTLTLSPSQDAVLSWPAVTTYTDGTLITTPVRYSIYRDVVSGFTPDETNLAATVSYTTTWSDTSLAGCGTNYYVVQARACGNESDPTNEVAKQFPAPPAAVNGLTAYPGGASGEAVLRWSPLTQRNDGSPLDPEDVATWKVYADTLPGHTTFWNEVAAPTDSILVSGLETCRTWYFNLRCVDVCGHEGDYVPASAIPLVLSAGCDPGTPAGPGSLAVTPSEDQLQLTWPPNTTDCDVLGYRIYYGSTDGGPYDGTEAAEGPSPIDVTTAQVIQGNLCRFNLTNLQTCQPYYLQVSTLDQCAPPHESSPTTQVDAITTCIACQMAACCLSWATTGPVNTEANLEVWSENPSGETLSRLTPTYANGASVTEIWYGRPLAKIWAADGSAGADGAVGPRPSGTLLDVDDVVVDSWTDAADGQPLRLVFDQDMRGTTIDLAFRGSSGTCTGTGTVAGAGAFDDWNDGDYSGWTKSAGTWSVSGGELTQTATSSSYILTKDGYTAADVTIEAKVRVLSGTAKSAYLAFRALDTSNYYLFGIRTDQDRVRVARIQGGAWNTEVAYASMVLNENQWYTLRVVVTGNRVRGWVDCQPLIDTTHSTMWTSGKVGLSTRTTSARFDDVRIYGGEVLP